MTEKKIHPKTEPKPEAPPEQKPEELLEAGTEESNETTEMVSVPLKDYADQLKELDEWKKQSKGIHGRLAA